MQEPAEGGPRATAHEADTASQGRGSARTLAREHAAARSVAARPAQTRERTHGHEHQQGALPRKRRIWERLAPNGVRLLTHSQRMRFHIYQVLAVSGVVSPPLAEGLTWITTGHPAKTLFVGLGLSAFNLINYAACYLHKQFMATAAFGVGVSNLIMLLAIYATGGPASPIASASLITVLMAGLVTGQRTAWLFALGAAALFFVPQDAALFGPPTPERYFLALGCVSAAAGIWVYELERLTFAKRRDDVYDLIDHATDPVGMLLDGEIVYQNRVFIALTGKDASQHAVTAEDLYPAWAVTRLHQVAMPHAIRHGSWTGEMALYGSAGNEIPTLQTINVREHDGGEVIRSSMLIKDISELKQNERKLVETKEQAAQALAYKSQFLANMSHEIRTPLNGILGMVTLLKDETQEAATLGKLETIERCGEHLIAIINDILDLSKLESGKLELERRPFDPARVLDEAVALFQPLAQERDNVIHAEVRGSGAILSDEARFRQIVYNLLGNAVKFTLKGEIRVELEVFTEEPKRYLTLRVADTGVGIASEKLSQIFNPFEQADASTSRRFGGSGLGLTICKRLADLFGGMVSVVSEVGTGSTFTFSFEAPSAVPSQHVVLADRPASAHGSAMRVLVADDNMVNQMVAGGFLRKLGFEVDLASNGLEVLARLEHNKYAVILMDCHMPEMDGLEATRQVRKRYGAARPRIIALTASAMPEERQRCLEAGMDDFLAKPIRMPELKRALRTAGSGNRT